MNLKDFIRSIPDYPKKGILFRDITTLIKNENAFAETINQIIERSKKFIFTKIAAIESRRFVFASAVSFVLKKPFIMLRKKNKLPADVHSIDFELEYGTATIEVHKDSINDNDTVLIIDDLIATGGTAEAAAGRHRGAQGPRTGGPRITRVARRVRIVYGRQRRRVRGRERVKEDAGEEIWA